MLQRAPIPSTIFDEYGGHRKATMLKCCKGLLSAIKKNSYLEYQEAEIVDGNVILYIIKNVKS